ncbi:23S rRNA (pseudouridine(1915)-N(3))-methyltransferase RlmH [Oceanicella actignis]|uniref:23S rRNA (pseudouridine(1915)-N(3))-methyltransferase RlmH n=1 Tax=Oceanicella actignis TaxID=1189325 RepID=UPI000932DBD5|nr:23S rRNA (pseudouridine(1915)-N(3))-methyltransferase RlmH [Oceanicella actignis]
MKISILAVGRLRRGPEGQMVADYLKRFDQTGRRLGLGPAQLREVEDRRGGGAEAESALLLAALPDGAALVALDERGETPSSPEFARWLAEWRDQGRGHVAFAIGGADGHAPALRARADRLLSFGPMVWPHMLARVMLAEQLYRAASILAGAPYHRA